MIVARCLGHAAEGPIGSGLFLKAFDFEAAFDERAAPGTGRPTFTADRAEALRFADMAEFQAFYRRVPECCPIRPTDGGPNRPMTGYHWSLERADL